MLTNRNGEWWPAKPPPPKKVKQRHKKSSDTFKDLSRFYRVFRVVLARNTKKLLDLN